jgi:hypothetical protein
VLAKRNLIKKVDENNTIDHDKDKVNEMLNPNNRILKDQNSDFIMD